MRVVKLVKRVIPTGKCIYCGEVKEFSREHYLPECLGTFAGFETLDDRICEDCNGRCGRELEEQFCRGGDIAYFRHILDIKGKKSHKGTVDYFLRGSGGASPLRMKGNIPGGDEEVHFQLVRSTGADGKLGIDYMPQIILTAESGELHHILLGNMREPEELKAKVDALEIGKLKQVNVIATPEERERIEKLTSCFLILEKSKWEELPMTGTTYTTTSFEVTDKYFRAIAKIGFHYILKHFRNFRGDEDFFAGIRGFITDGGDISQFVRRTQKQVIQIKEGYAPGTSGHIVLARANERVIWCKLQFFLGRGAVPFVYELGVARNQTKLVYDITSGHSFCYYADGPKDGKLGVMEPLVWIHTAPTGKRA